MEPFLEFTGFSNFVSTSFVQGCSNYFCLKMQFETQRLNIISIDRVLPQSQKRKTVEMLCLYIQQQAFFKVSIAF